jgi:DNA helicase-2/ATP-dependent DNA helicase PcrA
LDISKFDSKRFLTSEETERRLYYVALTRSKKFLYITTADLKIDGKRRASISRFFDEIPDTLFITTDQPDPTKRKPCKNDGVPNEIRFPTSYSELAYYLNCSYDYKMRFIYGFNPGIVAALGFGKQVHNVINLMHKEYENTKQIPAIAQISKLVNDHFYLRYASTTISDRLKESAIKSLAKYVELWKKDFSLTLKTERAFEFELDNALISGSIDMIKRNDGDETVLEVIDFKTGKPENDLLHKYQLQLQLYTIAAQEALGINSKKALIHFLDADKNERLAVQTETASLNKAKSKIKSSIKGITSANFKRDASHDKHCLSCDWCELCPKRIGFKGSH